MRPNNIVNLVINYNINIVVYVVNVQRLQHRFIWKIVLLKENDCGGFVEIPQNKCFVKFIFYIIKVMN